MRTKAGKKVSEEDEKKRFGETKNFGTILMTT
jgi:hypothetical protein